VCPDKREKVTEKRGICPKKMQKITDILEDLDG
jgi:hypothetical protein